MKGQGDQILRMTVPNRTEMRRAPRLPPVPAQRDRTYPPESPRYSIP